LTFWHHVVAADRAHIAAQDEEARRANVRGGSVVESYAAGCEKPISLIGRLPAVAQVRNASDMPRNKAE